MSEFRVNTAKKGKPFPHFWEMCVGSGHAAMGLRTDWREQLKKAHDDLGFRYVRFHGLLDDDMSVCVREANHFNRNAPTKLRYTFYNVDQIFDFLLSIGMKPFIELGYMPEALASGTTTCFHYKGNITPPADYAEWEKLVHLLTEHLVERYGLDEVRTWFFEVWNEPNLRFFWDGTQEEYFQLYAHAVRAVRSVDNQLKVGGPATSINAWLPDIQQFCQDNDVPLDFLSTHHYPTDDPLWRNSDLTIEEFFQQFASEMGKYKRGVLKEMTTKAHEQAGGLPLYYTEWNISAALPDPLHDESYAAALVAKAIIDNDGLVDAYSFWTFSDLFEEQGQFGEPFHGGFGLQTIYGTPKPTYRVFELLHRLGNERLTVSGDLDGTVEMAATRKDGRIDLLVYNHNIPAGEIKEEAVTIRLAQLPAVSSASITRIDAQHVNPKQAWIELGSPAYPTASELEEIAQAAQLTTSELPVTQEGDGCVLQFTLPPHGVAHITLEA